MNKDVIICRCEEVTLSTIMDSFHHGAYSSKEVKLRTRAGMGICQGRTCRPLIDRLTAYYTDSPIPDQSSLTHQFPVRPVLMTELSRKP